MKRISLIVVFAAAALAAALPGQAAAALPYTQALASCSNWQDGVGTSIVVSPPDMTPLGNMAFSSNGGIVTNPTQTVAYRVTIARLVGATWYAYSRGPWMAVEVSGWAASGNLAWTNLSTNRLEYGGRRFWVEQPGQYAVWVDYYWYANQYFPSASTGAYLAQIYGTGNAICHF